MKKCPYCAEEIQDDAIYCRWCKHDLSKGLIQTPTEGKELKTDPNPPTLISRNALPTPEPINKTNKPVIVLLGFFLILIIIGLIGMGISKGRTVYTENARSYPTNVPTRTPVNSSFPKYTPIYVTKTQNSCTLWSSISLNDVGKTVCVYGIVRNSWFSEQQWAQIFTFSSDPESVYFIKYSYIFEEGIDGHCVTFTGKIDRVYNTPVIYIQSNEAVWDCD